MSNIITLEREVLLLRIRLKAVVTFTWMRILAKAGIVLCRLGSRKSHRRTAIRWSGLAGMMRRPIVGGQTSVTPGEMRWCTMMPTIRGQVVGIHGADVHHSRQL